MLSASTGTLRKIIEIPESGQCHFVFFHHGENIGIFPLAYTKKNKRGSIVI